MTMMITIIATIIRKNIHIIIIIMYLYTRLISTLCKANRNKVFTYILHMDSLASLTYMAS